MKKLISVLSAVMVATILTIPAAAADIAVQDDFSKADTFKKWVVDIFAPEDFDISKGEVYLAVGDNGYRKNRPDEQKDKAYAMQGYKLKADNVSADAWTAAVKIKIDDTWYGTREDKDVRRRKETVESQKILENKKKVEFRVDVEDEKYAPTISLIKGGDGAPTFKYYDPNERQSWGTAEVAFELPEAQDDTPSNVKKMGKAKQPEKPRKEWYTMVISCKNGVITYSIDSQKIGSYQIAEEAAEPEYLALSMQNFDRPDVSIWDDCRLYDGIYTYTEE